MVTPAGGLEDLGRQALRERRLARVLTKPEPSGRNLASWYGAAGPGASQAVPVGPSFRRRATSKLLQLPLHRLSGSSGHLEVTRRL